MCVGAFFSYKHSMRTSRKTQLYALASNAAQVVTLHTSDFNSILQTLRRSANTRGTVPQTVNSGLYIYLFGL